MVGKHHVVASIVGTFQKQARKKYCAVPPVGCFCCLCMTPRVFTTQDMLWIVNCLRQFVVAVPCFALMQMWAIVSLPKTGGIYNIHTVSMCVKIGQILSATVALQGLFSLYKA